MYKITVTGGPEVSEKLRSKATSFREVFTGRLNAILLQLRGKIQAKLSGEVLQVRSGRLRDSVEIERAHVEGHSIKGAVFVPPDNPAHLYGTVHELGASGPWRIISRRGMLKFTNGQEEIFRKYVQHPGLPQRSFFGSTVREEKQNIIAQIEEAVKESLRWD